MRLYSPTHVTYSLVSKVTMIKIGRRFIPPTQLLLHMKLYRTVVNSVPTWSRRKRKHVSTCGATCANGGANWCFCVSARPSFERTVSRGLFPSRKGYCIIHWRTVFVFLSRDFHTSVPNTGTTWVRWIILGHCSMTLLFCRLIQITPFSLHYTDISGK